MDRLNIARFPRRCTNKIRFEPEIGGVSPKTLLKHCALGKVITIIQQNHQKRSFQGLEKMYIPFALGVYPVTSPPPSPQSDRKHFLNH